MRTDLAARLWMMPDGLATAKALDYSLKRWVALTRYLDDGQLPIDNNRIEQQMRPIAVGRKTGCSLAPCVQASELLWS